MTAAVTLATLGNGPAFSAQKIGVQSNTINVITKVTITNEIFDTNSNYDAANSRFQPTVAGYYQVNASVSHNFSGASGSSTYSYIYKNGIVYAITSNISNVTGGPYGALGLSALIYFNGSTDFAEVYAMSSNNVPTIQVDSGTYFSAALVRGA